LLEIIEQARCGDIDYDFSSLEFIAEGGQGKVSSIKSNIDGIVYVSKQLKHLKENNSAYEKTEAEREIDTLRKMDHPLIPQIADIVKDPEGFTCIIFRKCKCSL
jgi:serine/threonine protein kinase